MIKRDLISIRSSHPSFIPPTTVASNAAIEYMVTRPVQFQLCKFFLESKDLTVSYSLESQVHTMA